VVERRRSNQRLAPAAAGTVKQFQIILLQRITDNAILAWKLGDNCESDQDRSLAIEQWRVLIEPNNRLSV
jgi:hypothetical protein